jgi:hypothetical protein
MRGGCYVPFTHIRSGCSRRVNHSSPGRFYAVAELKLFVAYLLLTYDVRVPEGKTLPEWWFKTIMGKDPEVEVEFRRRRT